MNIGGIQKSSLIDFPGRPAAVVFTQGCGWCCPYCHNGKLRGVHTCSPFVGKAVFSILESRPPEARNLVISGGEPTKQEGLFHFLEEARERGIRVKLDTNGARPHVLRAILVAGLVEYVAMDVKGPLDRYHEFCGVKGFADAVAGSIDVLRAGETDYEFRTTVVPALHQPEDFHDMGLSLRGGRRLILQAFKPDNALTPQLRKTPEPTPSFMQACKEQADKWLPVEMRG